MLEFGQYKILKFVNTTMDFDYYFQMVNDEKVMEMITGKPLDYTEAREDFKNLLKINAISPNFGTFKIIDKTKGCLVGLAKLEITESKTEIAELGYIIIPEYWGKGIGTLISTNLVSYAKSTKSLKGLFAIIDPKNVASRKILNKNGFQFREYKDFDGLPGEILELVF